MLAGEKIPEGNHYRNPKVIYLAVMGGFTPGVDVHEIRRLRLRQLIDTDFDGVNAQFARQVGAEPSYINRIFSSAAKHRKNIGEDLARKWEKILDKPRNWFDQASEVREPTADYIVLPHGGHPSTSEFELVVNKGFRGSCGGGKINWEERLKHPLAFQRRWLEQKGVTTENALILYADGHSMEDFIQDGDVVLFNRSRTDIISGEIYAVEHPEGIRIKRLRLDYDGSIILASDNPDKARYPDDRIPASKAESLRVLGKFVWRGGG